MSILELLAEHKVCRISLPTRSGTSLHLECVARCSAAPHIETIFLPGTLPVGELDTSVRCQLFFEVGNQPHAVKTEITEIIGDNRLKLTYAEVFSPAQQREYFRVDTEIALEFRHHEADEEEPTETYQGKVNLSGGGIYFPVQKTVKVRSNLSLHLILGDPFGKVSGIVGEVVRTHLFRKHQPWIGVKFIEIAPQDRDRIIAFCLAEQRRILRQRVKILASF